MLIADYKFDSFNNGDDVAAWKTATSSRLDSIVDIGFEGVRTGITGPTPDPVNHIWFADQLVDRGLKLWWLVGNPQSGAWTSAQLGHAMQAMYEHPAIAAIVVPPDEPNKFDQIKTLQDRLTMIKTNYPQLPLVFNLVGEQMSTLEGVDTIAWSLDDWDILNARHYPIRRTWTVRETEPGKAIMEFERWCEYMKAKAKLHGKPWAAFVQSWGEGIAYDETSRLRLPTYNELSLMLHTAKAYGAKDILCFTVGWANAIIDDQLNRPTAYDGSNPWLAIWDFNHGLDVDPVGIGGEVLWVSPTHDRVNSFTLKVRDFASGGDMPLTNMETDDWKIDETGRALQFDSQNEFIKCTSNNAARLALNSKTYTVAGWFQTLDLADGDQTAFFAGTSGMFTRQTIGIRIQGAWVTVRFGDGTSVFTLQVANPTPSDWSHVAVVRNGDAVKMIVNGSEIVSGTTSYHIGANEIVIGARNTLGSFNGLLDNWRVLDRPATDAEIAALFNEGRMS